MVEWLNITATVVSHHGQQLVPVSAMARSRPRCCPTTTTHIRARLTRPPTTRIRPNSASITSLRRPPFQPTHTQTRQAKPLRPTTLPTRSHTPPHPILFHPSLFHPNLAFPSTRPPPLPSSHTTRPQICTTPTHTHLPRALLCSMARLHLPPRSMARLHALLRSMARLRPPPLAHPPPTATLRPTTLLHGRPNTPRRAALHQSLPTLVVLMAQTSTLRKRVGSTLLRLLSLQQNNEGPERYSYSYGRAVECPGVLRTWDRETRWIARNIPASMMSTIQVSFSGQADGQTNHSPFFYMSRCTCTPLYSPAYRCPILHYVRLYGHSPLPASEVRGPF